MVIGPFLCAFGWHRWEQWRPQSVQDGFVIEYTNAVCARCCKRGWFAWEAVDPKPEDDSPEAAP